MLEAGVHRNINILEREYEAYPDNERLRFFLMRDYFEAGKVELVEAMIAYTIKNPPQIITPFAGLCSTLGYYFAYEHINNGNQLPPKDIAKGKYYAGLAIRFSRVLAEPHVLLGDLAEREGNIKEAVRQFMIALSKQTGGRNGLAIQRLPMYHEVPCTRLAIIYNQQGKHEKALNYAREALKDLPGHAGLTDIYNDSLSKLKEV
jgi:tetratricopeptide (TPR) repeat protein